MAVLYRSDLMRLFVSYTRRDGQVNEVMLRQLKSYLAETFEPFIHAVDEKDLRFQQLGVVMALLRCHLILVIESPGIQNSPWVRFELALGRLLIRPIIRLPVELLGHWRHCNEGCENLVQNHNKPMQPTVIASAD